VREVERRYSGRVEVIRNEKNLGRIGNWNRCVEIAEERSFEFFTFLFVGDRWVSGAALQKILDRFRASSAALAMVAFQMRDKENRLIRTAKRFSISDEFLEVKSGCFLDAAIATGYIPIAPLQSNLFRVLDKGILRFDPAIPTNTDVEATVEFLCRAGRSVLLCAQPFMAWRKHPGRFFLSNDLVRFAIDGTAQLQRLSARTARRVDWPVANALLFLNTALGIWLFVPPRRWPREGTALIRHLFGRGGGFSLGALVRYTAERVFLNRGILRFQAHPVPDSGR
jgi:hypothetical protein